jgi:hypothetical protein
MPIEQNANLRTSLERMSGQLPVDGTTKQLTFERWKASSQQILARRHSIKRARKYEAQQRTILRIKPKPKTGHRF